MVRPVERFPPGYPRFCGLIGSHTDFSLASRFSVVRARLLLQKQARVSALEKQLEQCDLQETKPIHLGSVQQDQNPTRLQILRDLDEALAEYGMSIAMPLSLSSA